MRTFLFSLIIALTSVLAIQSAHAERCWWNGRYVECHEGWHRHEGWDRRDRGWDRRQYHEHHEWH